MIKKRSIALFILLGIVTLGIYPLVVLCIMGEEVNKICEGDGKHNMFYLLAVLLGLVTLGIYPVVWFAKAMNRLQDNAYRYGPTVMPMHSGASFALWFYFGSLIIVGPLVAVCYFISDVNAFAGVAGCIQPLPYTPNMVERVALADKGNLGRQFQFSPEPAPAAYAMPPVQQTPAPQLPMDTAPTAYNRPEVAVAAPTRGRGSVKGTISCVSGMYAGYDFPIENNEEITIGTDSSSASIVIDADSPYVSGTHCVIRYDAATNSYLVTDYSTNGTYTSNDTRLTKGMPKVLPCRETIYLGDKQNSFRLG